MYYSQIFPLHIHNQWIPITNDYRLRNIEWLKASDLWIEIDDSTLFAPQLNSILSIECCKPNPIFAWAQFHSHQKGVLPVEHPKLLTSSFCQELPVLKANRSVAIDSGGDRGPPPIHCVPLWLVVVVGNGYKPLDWANESVMPLKSENRVECYLVFDGFNKRSVGQLDSSLRNGLIAQCVVHLNEDLSWRIVFLQVHSIGWD
jgi:hypothetical protein